MARRLHPCTERQVRFIVSLCDGLDGATVERCFKEGMESCATIRRTHTRDLRKRVAGALDSRGASAMIDALIFERRARGIARASFPEPDVDPEPGWKRRARLNGSGVDQ